MTKHLETVISGVFAVCAIAIATAVVRREFFAPPPTVRAANVSTYVESWEDVLPAGRLVGNANARVKVVEFTDLECPFCRVFNGTLKAVSAKYPDDVAFVFVHKPLEMHRFALPAARAAECASEAGRFSEMVDAIFEKQDSLGLKSWTSFAAHAGLRDTVAFAKCVSATASMPKVDAGLALAKRFGISSTPTVMLNGWRYGKAPGESELIQAIGDLLAGKQPYPGYPKP